MPTSAPFEPSISSSRTRMPLQSLRPPPGYRPVPTRHPLRCPSSALLLVSDSPPPLPELGCTVLAASPITSLLHAGYRRNPPPTSSQRLRPLSGIQNRSI